MKITDQMLRTAAAAICCKANELGCAAMSKGAEFGTCMAGTFIEDARRCFAVIEPTISRLAAERDALKNAAENFVAKVERGEARSKESYAEFKAALAPTTALSDALAGGGHD